MSKALDDISAERRRQIDDYGMTSENDDEHTKGEMIRAALNYLAAACIATALGGKSYDDRPPLDRMGYAISWPWAPKWWKPGLVRRMLVKVGALVVAEIERIDRAEARNG
jgi:hypothetical protein